MLREKIESGLALDAGCKDLLEVKQVMDSEIAVEKAIADCTTLKSEVFFASGILRV